MQHDYKAALAKCNLLTHEDAYHIFKYHGEAIRSALRIADALMGDPSEAMVEMAAEAAVNATRQYVDLPKTKLNKLRVDSKNSYVREARAVIKAMRDQLLKEVNGEQLTETN